MFPQNYYEKRNMYLFRLAATFHCKQTSAILKCVPSHAAFLVRAQIRCVTDICGQSQIPSSDMHGIEYRLF